MLSTGAADHYEILQISRKAESDTIHRVYHIMASRFHPDNPETGDVERFLLLKQAYQVLSDPVARMQYDATCDSDPQPQRIFEQRDFVDGIEGEMNRRLGVLSILYHHRRLNADHPGVSVLELEKRMTFPREYLTFTLWYLRSKGYLTMQDNSDHVLTASGADYVESCCSTNTLARALLTRGNDTLFRDSTSPAEGQAQWEGAAN